MPPEPEGAAAPLIPIAAVERETGLGKDTLRAWERRYGFPLPERDAAGVRGYPRPLVERLCQIRRALLAGWRPGRLLALPYDELENVLGGFRATPAAVGGAGPAHDAAPLPMADALAALRLGGAAGLRHWLTRALAHMGMSAFVVEGIAPLTVAIGEAWLGGSVPIYEEHLYSEAVQAVLRSGLLPFQAGLETSAPRVLLTTIPGEEHGLGLLMAEALMTLEACRCLPLGVQTPVADILAACRAHGIDVVALSFSASLPVAQTVASLLELRRLLPADIAIWAGGGSPALRGLSIPGIQVMPRLADIPLAVAAWRRGGGTHAD